MQYSHPDTVTLSQTPELHHDPGEVFVLKLYWTNHCKFYTFILLDQFMSDLKLPLSCKMPEASVILFGETDEGGKKKTILGLLNLMQTYK